jgi:hypothetical protein
VEEKKVCVGDLVQVLDGSWCMEMRHGKLTPATCPAAPGRQNERWRVLAVDCGLPTAEKAHYSTLWAVNSLLLERVGEPGHLLCSQPRFVKVVKPASATKTLEERVAELEKKVGLA